MAGPPTTSAGTVAPLVFDPSRPFWMQGGFAPTPDEVEAFDLEVTGALPPELSGLYVRNGSNPASGDSAHWFLGDGMVHGVALEAGRAAWYRNRFVDTPMVREGVGLTGGGPPGGERNQSNVSVIGHGGRLLSLGEVGFPYELSTADLSSVGPFDYGGALTTSMTAHPKIDPVTGEMHFFGYGFVPPYLTYHVADADGRLVYSGEVEVAGPTMIHDFAVTDRDAIFWELPVIFDLQIAIDALEGGGDAGFPFRWEPDYGARVGVMPLGGPVEAIRWVEIDPCYVFHGVNAFRSGDDVVLDVCRLPSMFTEEADLGSSVLHRWTVGTGGPDAVGEVALTFADEEVGDLSVDLPTLDRRVTGRPNRHAWYLMIDKSGPFPVEFSGLGHLDGSTGATQLYQPGDAYKMNEAFFVPASADAAEGEGWLLAYAWDRARDASDLAVFDAQALSDGPVARVHLPARVPYGFHGVWVPADDTGWS
jgi:carotenoid cleavage dioxygenase-like enzyme